MQDPIYNAIVAAKIGLLFSRPEAGYAIAALQPVEVSQSRPGVNIVGDALQFDREYVRSLTPNELKDCWSCSGKGRLPPADAKLVIESFEPISIAAKRPVRPIRLKCYAMHMRFLATLFALSAMLDPAFATQPATAKISVCFTPAERCEERFVDAIDRARPSIRLRAYRCKKVSGGLIMKSAGKSRIDGKAFRGFQGQVAPNSDT